MDETRSRIDATETLELLKDLVKINSVNPSLVPGAPGEAEVAEYIGDYMRDLGLVTRVEEVEPGRVNAVGTIKGTGGG